MAHPDENATPLTLPPDYLEWVRAQLNAAGIDCDGQQVLDAQSPLPAKQLGWLRSHLDELEAEREREELLQSWRESAEATRKMSLSWPLTGSRQSLAPFFQALSEDWRFDPERDHMADLRRAISLEFTLYGSESFAQAIRDGGEEGRRRYDAAVFERASTYQPAKVQRPRVGAAAWEQEQRFRWHRFVQLSAAATNWNTLDEGQRENYLHNLAYAIPLTLFTSSFR